MKPSRFAVSLAALACLALETGTPARAAPAGPAPAAPALDVAMQTPQADAPMPRDPAALAVENYLSDLLATAPTPGAKARRTAAAAFYAARGNAPVWVEGGLYTPRAEALLAVVAASSEEGIDPLQFDLPQPPRADVPATNWSLAEAEVKLTLAALTYAERAMTGSVSPASISPMITREPARPDRASLLARLAASPDAATDLLSFNPPQEGYRRLKAKLAEVRSRPQTTPPAPIPVGETLRPGMRDARVAMLRDRLGLGTPATMTDAEVYDGELEAAVRAFQKSEGLAADAIVGPRTLEVLNGEERGEEAEIIANMEMWRWMPRDLGTDHIFVNVPEFMVRVMRGGQIAHEARVVVGTPKNQTPVFSDRMQYLVVNPYWNVPVSIASKEMLEAIRKNPAGYFARHGYEAVVDGKVVDPSMIWWDESSIRKVRIRQPPGEENALGHIKFMFPNQHAVYLHDTPSRSLFERDFRAYSHGCVRVHEPFAFAEAILAGEPDVTVDRLKALIGGKERRVDLANGLPVHLAYFTAWVDDAGVLQMRKDLYGHTDKVKAALGLSG